MKAHKPEPTIKRSRAAELLDKTTRTLRRYESLGILVPIKLNCRSVVYPVSQVQAILDGKVQTSESSVKDLTPRAQSGEFFKRAA